MKKTLKYRALERLFKFFGSLSTKNRMRLGATLTVVTRKFLKRRIDIVRKNIELCFPEVSQEQRDQWCEEHIRILSQSIIDRGLMWYGSPERIRENVNLERFEIMESILEEGKPLILLAPHFAALDVAATRLTMLVKESATIYTEQSDPTFDAIIHKGRTRFNQTNLIKRSDGVRGMLRFLKRGVPVYYLPDMDFGRKESIFVPFFGIPAATLPTTSVLARKWNATIVPVITQWHKETGRYTVQFLDPLQDFPGEDSDVEATARLNLLLEDWIRKDPPQYYWVHRRFKTRPNPDDPKFY